MGGRRLSVDDREAMERAIALAWSGWGRVGQNPLVGAVVLRDGTVIGEGFHAEFGGPHGEVVALLAAGERARGAELVDEHDPGHSAEGVEGVLEDPQEHLGRLPEDGLAVGLARVA